MTVTCDCGPSKFVSRNLARCDRKVKNEQLCFSFPLSEVALLPVFKSVECDCLLVEK